MAATSKDSIAPPPSNCACRAKDKWPISGKALPATLSCDAPPALLALKFGNLSLNAMFISSGGWIPLNAYLQKFRLPEQPNHIQLAPRNTLLINILICLNCIVLPTARITQAQHPVHQRSRIDSIAFCDHQQAITNYPGGFALIQESRHICNAI